MALWHERLDRFDADERDLIRPPRPEVRAFRVADLDRYRRERERLVVKRSSAASARKS